MAKKKTNQELIAEENEIARSLGLDYGTYKAYLQSGYLNHYLRIRFHNDVDRNAENTQIEESWIGQMHGKGNCRG